MAKRYRVRALLRYLTKSFQDPESVARGLGLGLFVGLLPSFGLQILIAFFMARLINANRLAAVLGTLVSNPLTTVPLSLLSLWLGDWVLSGSQFRTLDLESIEWMTLLKSGDLLQAYLVGCLLLGFITGISGYTLSRVYFTRKRTVLHTS